MWVEALEPAVAQVERAGDAHTPVMVPVASGTLADFEEMAIELAVTAHALELCWGAPASRGGRPPWLPSAEATTAWHRHGSRLFVALHRNGATWSVSLGAGPL